MIKFQGFGGEIGIAKDQIQSIVKAGEKGSPGMVIGEEEQPLRSEPSPVGEAATEKREAPADISEKPLSPEEKLAEERAKEEKEYQKRVKEITEQIREAKNRYSLAAKGSEGAQSNISDSEKGPKQWNEESSSKLKDVLQLPSWTYNPKEQELSDLNSQILKLEKERDRLIEEMKQKGFDTGSLFLE